MAEQKPSRHRLSSTLLRGALAISLIAICFLAFTPLQIPAVSSLNDKLSHILAFLYLALLCDFSWPEADWNFTKALSLLGYGLFIETVQAFLPHRFFSLLDLAADGLGLMIYSMMLPGLLRINWIKRLRQKNEQA
ncbi:MAG: VanZ family protein [Candidatus Thiodiazotropha lotti]|nr:VanZ family protein [Candidatus Thiodiazotropha lotti]MCW4221243.1 VanZ family protein [Candidatus Thiodiazotropha lotti]